MEIEVEVASQGIMKVEIEVKVEVTVASQRRTEFEVESEVEAEVEMEESDKQSGIPDRIFSPEAIWNVTRKKTIMIVESIAN